MRSLTAEQKARKRAQDVVWVNANRERVRAYHRAWEEKNRAHVNAKRNAADSANREAVRASQRARNPRYLDKRRGYKLAKYGLSVDGYNSMLLEQGGVCAICRRPESQVMKGTRQSLTVDHDHETGHVRGLLCGNCNRGMGQLGDDAVRLRAAAEYLEKASLR